MVILLAERFSFLTWYGEEINETGHKYKMKNHHKGEKN